MGQDLQGPGGGSNELQGHPVGRKHDGKNSDAGVDGNGGSHSLCPSCPFAVDLKLGIDFKIVYDAS